jgi:uncharacterized OB-fold protein
MTILGEQSIGRAVLAEDGGGALRLVASRCPRCGDVRVPDRRQCVNDGVACEQILLSGRGVIYEAVYVSLPPEGFDRQFWTGYIDLDEGPRFFAQIECADGEEPPRHGQRVYLRVDEIGVRPILAPVFIRDGGEPDAQG